MLFCYHYEYKGLIYFLLAGVEMGYLGGWRESDDGDRLVMAMVL